MHSGDGSGRVDLLFGAALRCVEIRVNGIALSVHLLVVINLSKIFLVCLMLVYLVLHRVVQVAVRNVYAVIILSVYLIVV